MYCLYFLVWLLWYGGAFLVVPLVTSVSSGLLGPSALRSSVIGQLLVSQAKTATSPLLVPPPGMEGPTILGNPSPA